jgi:hypothetical protein
MRGGQVEASNVNRLNSASMLTIPEQNERIAALRPSCKSR